MSNLFCDLVFDLNLVQMINEPTHNYSPKYLRLIVFPTADDIITSLSVHLNASYLSFQISLQYPSL